MAAVEVERIGQILELSWKYNQQDVLTDHMWVWKKKKREDKGDHKILA